jgi:hypothetical protein
MSELLQALIENKDTQEGVKEIREFELLVHSSIGLERYSNLARMSEKLWASMYFLEQTRTHGYEFSLTYNTHMIFC